MYYVWKKNDKEGDRDEKFSNFQSKDYITNPFLLPVLFLIRWFVFSWENSLSSVSLPGLNSSSTHKRALVSSFLFIALVISYTRSHPPKFSSLTLPLCFCNGPLIKKHHHFRYLSLSIQFSTSLSFYSFLKKFVYFRFWVLIFRNIFIHGVFKVSIFN